MWNHQVHYHYHAVVTYYYIVNYLNLGWLSYRDPQQAGRVSAACILGSEPNWGI